MLPVDKGSSNQSWRSLRALRSAGFLLLSLVSACERPLLEARSAAVPRTDGGPGGFEPAGDAGATPVDRARANPHVADVPHSLEQQHLAARYQGASAQTRFRGEASYYSNALAGRPTASGQPYDPSLPTAAHRSLPFGSVVRVTREDTGRSVYVRINDRGPFVKGRVLDVSGSVARELDMLRRGVVRVRVEVLELGPKRKPSRKRKRR